MVKLEARPSVKGMDSVLYLFYLVHFPGCQDTLSGAL